MGALLDLFGQTVVEVVVHLGGEILIVECAEIDLFLVGHMPLLELKCSSKRSSWNMEDAKPALPKGSACSASWNRTVSRNSCFLEVLT